MTTSDIKFSDHEIKMVEQYRDAQDDRRLKMRFIALLMLAPQSSLEHVSFILGFSVRTIKNWLDIYFDKGIDALNSFNYKPKESYLSFHQINQVAIFVIFSSLYKI